MPEWMIQNLPAVGSAGASIIMAWMFLGFMREERQYRADQWKTLGDTIRDEMIQTRIAINKASETHGSVAETLRETNRLNGEWLKLTESALTQRSNGT